MATTPPWIVQSSPTGASKAPPWLIKSDPTTPAPTTQYDPTKQGKLQGIWDYTKNANADTGMARVPTDEYAPYVNFLENTQSGEDGMTRSTTWNEMNWDKLPNKGMTKYGKIGEQAISVKNIEGLRDKSQVYFDDNYGWVTSKANVNHDHNFIGKYLSPKTVTPLMMAGAFSGLAGIAGLGGLAGGAVKAVPGLVNSAISGSFNPVGLGLSALGASGYVPSWVVPAAKAGMSLSQMYGKG